jgi:Family of unknown function (DUF6233)
LLPLYLSSLPASDAAASGRAACLSEHKIELVSDWTIDQLEAIRAHLAWQLRQVEHWLAVARGRQAQERTEARARRFVLERGLSHGRDEAEPVAVHQAGCALVGWSTVPVTQDEAVALLVQDAVPACPICRPDEALGLPSDMTAPRRPRG